MGIIEVTLLIAAVWCLVLAFGTALFAVAARADEREDVMRGSVPVAMAEMSETAPVQAGSSVIAA